MNNNPSKEEIINQAFHFHSQGNIQEARKYYQSFIDRGFKDYRVFTNYGVILKNLGKLKEAELYTRKAIKLNPNFANAYSNLGSMFKGIGKYKEAELYTRKAIELNPNLADAYSNLGSMLKDLGNLKEAEIYTRKAIKLNPNFADAYSNLGSILKDLGKLKEAEIYTRKAIELNPNFANAYSNLGSILKDLGNLKEAEIYTRKAIELNPNFAIAHSNLGGILKDLGNLKEAEVYTRKAIELNPNFADAHSNLGVILKNLGKLKEAEISFHKAIELNPDLAIAYYSLSILKKSNKTKTWQDKLFSKNLLNNQLEKDQVNIYFARANILHKESNFKESSRYLQLANNLKQKLYPSNVEDLLKKSKNLLIESKKESVLKKENRNFFESIFILGMPRSGSTLLESIISMNDNVDDLGEKNFFEESFLSWKNPAQNLNLEELYLQKINLNGNQPRITTNKWLYNYQYAGIIASHIPNAKIIHCFRNPLDNILSIYRAHFARGNEYSSSLVDCARLYLDQEEVMNEYKKRFRTKIYDLNYDSLVSNPNKEIKSLISWLGWKWEDKYLAPHLNPRSVSTASNIQVRSPINSKSVWGWKNYKDMLKPAMEIITKTERYKNLLS